MFRHPIPLQPPSRRVARWNELLELQGRVDCEAPEALRLLRTMFSWLTAYNSGDVCIRRIGLSHPLTSGGVLEALDSSRGGAGGDDHVAELFCWAGIAWRPHWRTHFLRQTGLSRGATDAPSACGQRKCRG